MKTATDIEVCGGLQLGANGTAMLEIPEYLNVLRWCCGTLTVEQVKSWIRICAAASMLIVLLHALWVHQDAPQMLQRVMLKMDHLDRQQTARWNLLQVQLVHLLHSLRDSGVSTHAGAPQACAAKVSARREQEQRKLEAMWQEALAIQHAETGAWNAVRTPMTLPGSSKRTPLTNMDTSTPVHEVPMSEQRAIKLANTAPKPMHAVLCGARGGQGAQDTSSMEKAAARTAEGADKKRAPVAASKSSLRERLAHQERKCQCGAGAARTQAGGGKRLQVQISNDDESEGTEDAEERAHEVGEGSLRRSPRGSAAKRRIAEHDDDDEHAGVRREKKLKAAQ